METASAEAEIEQFAASLLEKLPDRFEYVAANWFDGLLLPLGYERSEQSKVFAALKWLRDHGHICKESVKRVGGYQASRRANYPKPRRVVITKN